MFYTTSFLRQPKNCRIKLLKQAWYQSNLPFYLFIFLKAPGYQPKLAVQSSYLFFLKSPSLPAQTFFYLFIYFFLKTHKFNVKAFKKKKKKKNSKKSRSPQEIDLPLRLSLSQFSWLPLRFFAHRRKQLNKTTKQRTNNTFKGRPSRSQQLSQPFLGESHSLENH